LRLDDNAVKVGLKKGQIAQLPKSKFKRGAKTDDEARCSVCIDDLEEDQEVTYIPTCLHTFHTHCINKWLEQSKICPIWCVPSLPQLYGRVVSVSSILSQPSGRDTQAVETEMVYPYLCISV
jgi:hypothetical protein